jgi:hypothetical protein
MEVRSSKPAVRSLILTNSLHLFMKEFRITFAITGLRQLRLLIPNRLQTGTVGITETSTLVGLDQSNLYHFLAVSV